MSRIYLEQEQFWWINPNLLYCFQQFWKLKPCDRPLTAFIAFDQAAIEATRQEMVLE